MILSFCIKAEEMLSLMKQISRQDAMHEDGTPDSLFFLRCVVTCFLFIDTHRISTFVSRK
jgi:hypothetical protein